MEREISSSENHCMVKSSGQRLSEPISRFGIGSSRIIGSVRYGRNYKGKGFKYVFLNVLLYVPRI